MAASNDAAQSHVEMLLQGRLSCELSEDAPICICSAACLKTSCFNHLGTKQLLEGSACLLLHRNIIIAILPTTHSFVNSVKGSVSLQGPPTRPRAIHCGATSTMTAMPSDNDIKKLVLVAGGAKNLGGTDQSRSCPQRGQFLVHYHSHGRNKKRANGAGPWKETRPEADSRLKAI